MLYIKSYERFKASFSNFDGLKMYHHTKPRNLEGILKNGLLTTMETLWRGGKDLLAQSIIHQGNLWNGASIPDDEPAAIPCKYRQNGANNQP